MYRFVYQKVKKSLTKKYAGIKYSKNLDVRQCNCFKSWSISFEGKSEIIYGYITEDKKFWVLSRWHILSSEPFNVNLNYKIKENSNILKRNDLEVIFSCLNHDNNYCNIINNHCPVSRYDEELACPHMKSAIKKLIYILYKE